MPALTRVLLLLDGTRLCLPQELSRLLLDHKSSVDQARDAVHTLFASSMRKDMLLSTLSSFVHGLVAAAHDLRWAQVVLKQCGEAHASLSMITRVECTRRCTCSLRVRARHHHLAQDTRHAAYV